MHPIRRCSSLLVPVVLAALGTAQSPPPGFVYETLSDGQLANATAMAFLPDGGLLITERATGRIRIFRDGVLQVAPWATVPVGSFSSFVEQGLLGIAVDPDYLVNRYVYVYYTEPTLNENRIGRLTEVGGIGTNLTVLTRPGEIPTDWYHNGGTMVFGHDGTLFVASGDNYTPSNAQDLSNLLGKVLRYELPNLTVPTDNPFAGSPIYSYGHRNHFGLAIHPVTGELYQTENGLAIQDEINRIVPGGNYGWPAVEGNHPAPNPAYVSPLSTYSPTTAPTGMTFYAGEHFPASYRNVMFFTDYNQNNIHAVTLNAAGTAVQSQVNFDTLPGAGYGVLAGPDGSLYVLTNDLGGYGADELGRYVYTGEPVPSAQFSAVSNRALGGTATICIHSVAGETVVPWIGLSRFAAPVPTPYGNWWVPTDAIGHPVTVPNDGRVYLPLSLPNNRSFLGLSLHLQGISTSASGDYVVTNPADLVLRG
jgi:glucose/arabinose dehydrogenase